MSAMTTQSLEVERPRARLNLSRHRGLIAALVVFAALVAFVEAITPKGLSYYDVSSLITTGAPLALAAVGQTFVIIVGGFDLSAGAAISLVNAVVATIPQQSVGGQIGAVVAGIAIGSAVGAFNGFFVAFLRLQSIVVTLSTMFLVRGLTLLIMPDPGGSVAETLTKLFTGAAIPGVLPAAAIVIAGGLAIWLLVGRMKFGTAMFAVGSDADASHAVGIPVEWTRFGAFVLGGLFYGMAGVYIGAQTGSADPLVGDPLLLQSFTAVVLGGTLLGGGRGSAVGSVIGAYTLMLMINILLALDVSAYYSTIAEGVVLILAVVAASIGSDNVAVQSLRRAGVWLGTRSARILASQVATGVSAPAENRRWTQRTTTQRASWLDRNREQLRYVLPAYIAFVLVVIATQFVYSENIVFSLKYYNSLVVLSAFLAILGARSGRGDPVGRSRSLGALDDRLLRDFRGGADPGLKPGDDLGGPARARCRRRDRPVQWTGRGCPRSTADRGDACDEWRSPGRRAPLQQRHACRLRIAGAALDYDRKDRRDNAGCGADGCVHPVRRYASRPHGLRAMGLCRREQSARLIPVGRRRADDHHWRLCAQRLLRGAGRRLVHWFQRSGEPWHGR